MNPPRSPVRVALDTLYRASGALAVFALVMIAVFTLAQVIARLIGTIVPSADDFAGISMAAAVFLGLTHTLRAGGHVRMLVILDRLDGARRRVAELACAGFAALLIGYLLYYTVDMLLASHRMGERTLGLIPIPKWIPMLTMVFGLGILFIALVDAFVQIARGRMPDYAQREDAQTRLRNAAE